MPVPGLAYARKRRQQQAEACQPAVKAVPDAHVVSPPQLEQTGSTSSIVPPCGVCQLPGSSKYACPKCNLRYCSVACYKHETHATCTEDFYRAQVERELRGMPAVDRRRMTEILRRFENGQSSLTSPSGDDAGSSVHDVLGRKIDRAMEEDARDGDEDENENEELARIFEGMDIENASFDDLWTRLDDAQRERFLATVHDANACERLIARAMPTLWWMEKDHVKSDGVVLLPSVQEDTTLQSGIVELNDDDDEVDEPSQATPMTSKASIAAPLPHIKLDGVHPNALHNIVDLLFTYAYIIRLTFNDTHAMATEDPRFIQNSIWDASLVLDTRQRAASSNTTPFTAYASAEEAFVMTRERVGGYCGEDHLNVDVLSEDVARLSSSATNMERAVCDLFEIWRASMAMTIGEGSSASLASTLKSTERKLAFYVAYTRALASTTGGVCGRERLLSLHRSVDAEHRRLVEEREQYVEERLRVEAWMAEERRVKDRGPLVQEME